MTWYGAMAEALSAGNTERAWKLFEAALSVPIRLRLSPDPDACHLAALLFPRPRSPRAQPLARILFGSSLNM